MKIFDKLKNALFEEEYVEVEEKPKKIKEKKQKVNKKEIRETYFDNPEEEKPVAKRIIPPEKKTIETLQEEEEVTDNISFRDQDLVDPIPESKITMIEEKDLVVDEEPVINNEYETAGKRRSDNIYEEPKEEYIEPKEEPQLYQNSKKESFYDNYIPHAYGNYEKQREKSKEGFKPSPIISPIYGIVEDTNYAEQPRREVRITTPISREKMNLDDIRRKAYGNADVTKEEQEIPQVLEDEEKNTLVDLSDDSKTPEVNSITMGDAMEYFEDLGLEYNKDYIDKSKMTTVEEKEELEERPIQIHDNTIDEDEKEEVQEYNVLDDRKFTVSKTAEEDVDNDIIVTEKQDDEVVENNDSDNLFDLIDSMYE